ncbi:Athe_2463 domain-containing protein [Paenibacillus sp. GXUN7292]|uniref:Athe_2463 domain-containing protein n=1 Tax=Paenibacillus sp. GXUN7292 TaxID=3422499 RepID=UPI003D7E55FA
MSKRSKQIITAFSLVAMLLTFWPSYFADASQTVPVPKTINTFPNKCGYNPAVDGEIPSHVKPCSENGFKFNSKFYYQTWILNNNPYKTAPPKGLIVYGSPDEVTTAQSFKKGMQDAQANVNENEGHFYIYHKDYGRMVFGEWRFLGYDESGSLYPNDYFIRDSGDVTTQPVDKRWVFEPWKDLPSNYKYKPGSAGAVYRGEYPDTKSFDLLKTNIDRSIGFKFRDAPTISYADRDRVLPKEDKYTDVRNFMNIAQEPTVWEPGIGMMYHWHPVKKTLFYQSFPLLQQTPHEKSQNKAVCEVTPVSSKPIPLGKERFIEVDVKLTGTLQDEEHFGKRDMESAFYTRKDIDYWRLDLKERDTNNVLTRLSNKKTDGVVRKDNTASTIYKLKIDTEKLDKSDGKAWVYTTTGEAVIYYANHMPIDPSMTKAPCQLKVDFQTTTVKTSMLSDFAVIPEIVIDRRSELTKEKLGYVDYSYGKDADYYEFEITNIADGTKATKKFDPAIPEVKKPDLGYLDQAAVSKFLYDFIISKFPNETVTSNTGQRFMIKQTIVDKDATTNNSSTATRYINIVQNGSTNLCETLPSPPQYVTPNVDWPFDWYDVVPFPVTENAPEYVPHKVCETPPDYSQFSKRVLVDEKEINADQFFRGDYIFGEDKQGIRKVTVLLTTPDGAESHFTRHVVVHETKPKVYLQLEGLFKQNRTMRAFDRSAESNSAWTEANAPLEITSFSFVKTNDSALVCRVGYCESNLSEKLFMYKEPGQYQISLAAKRVIPYGNGKTITRYSDPYVVDFEILPDHRPAIIAHTYSEQISRLDSLPLFYDVQSTDGDFIAYKKLQVYYDPQNDGNFDQIVYETEDDVTELPVLDQLGQYKIVVEAREGTNEERLMEFITTADDKTHRYEGYFSVDNYAPYSHLYLDTPVELAELDVFLMLDKGLKQVSTDYVKGNRVTLTNDFTRSNMMANIGIWDMKTYTYSQDASTTRYTGTSYPSSTTGYTSSDGYSGTLSLSSVSNPKRRVDEGKEVPVTDSKTANGSCSNTVTTNYDKDGKETSQSSTSVCPQTQSYSDGKFSGTLSRTGESPGSRSCGSPGPSGYSCTRTWTATYSGTVYWTRMVYQEKWVEYDDYIGYYKGTIYKNIRQPYDAGFMKAVKNKYVVYITEQTISELPDLQHVLNKHDAKLIIVGKDAVQQQINHDGYVKNEGQIESVMQAVIDQIAENNPAIPKVLKLAGEPIRTMSASFDYEDDELPVEFDLLQITHDPDYYDHSLGLESFSGQSLLSIKNNNNWHPYQSEVTFHKPGKYIFYRKIKDKPSNDLNFAQYAYESNEAAVEVLVHRRPIADVTLDFDYVPNANMYRTTWIDMSYDLDHNVTRAATDRGIQDRTLRFQNQRTGEVFTKIPDMLPPGTYVLDYKAQDIEGEWSDPIQRTYVLPDAVPVQMKSNLKTVYSGFSLNSVPASEQLTAYELWTRYPYSISLQLSMGSYINKTVPYYTGRKNGNDIWWQDEVLTIPNTTPDGNYTFTVRGNGSVAGSNSSQTYTVKVVTPIHLKGEIFAQGENANKATVLVVNDSYDFIAHTTKYPDAAFRANATTVTLFKGTSYQRVINMASKTISSTGYGAKKWSYTHKIGAMPNGNYTIEWRSTTPNGNVEVMSQTVQVINNRPPTADFIWEPQPVYEGDFVQFKSIVDDLDKDRLTIQYELTSPKGVKTNYSYIFNAPYESTAPAVRMLDPGDWTMVLKVSDGKAPTVSISKAITVLPLHITGSVHHTDLWNEHRQAYNRKQSGQADIPRSYNMFWAGEQFVLKAETTHTTTATNAEKVEVSFLDFKAVMENEAGSSYKWQGELWDSSFQKLPEGEATFRFTVWYNNGTVKTDDVQVIIKGDVTAVTGVHRVQ